MLQETYKGEKLVQFGTARLSQLECYPTHSSPLRPSQIPPSVSPDINLGFPSQLNILGRFPLQA